MNQAIYPETLAEMTKARAGEKYRPSNGTEGDCFFAGWCCKCQRDKAMRERTATLTDQIGFDWKINADMQKVYATEYLSVCFRNLEIEEPK